MVCSLTVSLGVEMVCSLTVSLGVEMVCVLTSLGVEMVCSLTVSLVVELVCSLTVSLGVEMVCSLNTPIRRSALSCWQRLMTAGLSPAIQGSERFPPLPA